MDRRMALSLLAAAALAGCASSAQDAGWVTLIDGDKGLDNWARLGDANWRAEGGLIVADAGKGGFLVSRADYKDFAVRAEFRDTTQFLIRVMGPGALTGGREGLVVALKVRMMHAGSSSPRSK